MDIAFEAAEAASKRGEVPVGAVVLGPDGQVLAVAGNEVEAGDPTAHAEILALRAAAAKLGRPRLEGCELVVTLEPCSMCATAISHARIKRLVFAAYDPKGGGVEHGPRMYRQPTCHHRPEVVGGVQAEKAEMLLKQFFAGLRAES
ncbi:MAG: nucleoside deaminase [Alphaproteobacteria bacterium]|nr:nucleoside deaminase [Alphaproteobacteria bacterium]PHY00033.1 MAG: tRNA-specific adenosine deaminase [Rhodospirillaceae bacterium]